MFQKKRKKFATCWLDIARDAQDRMEGVMMQYRRSIKEATQRAVHEPLKRISADGSLNTYYPDPYGFNLHINGIVYLQRDLMQILEKSTDKAVINLIRTLLKELKTVVGVYRKMTANMDISTDKANYKECPYFFSDKFGRHSSGVTRMLNKEYPLFLMLHEKEIIKEESEIIYEGFITIIEIYTATAEIESYWNKEEYKNLL